MWITALLTGIILGTITGLIPGLHFNSVIAIIIAYPYMIPFHKEIEIATMIIAMATTHTFMDSIPSTFLGSPDSGTVLGVLPAHRLLINGKGSLAVRLTIIGSIGSLILGFLFFNVWISVAKIIYLVIKPFIGYILIMILVISFLSIKEKTSALLIVLLSIIAGEISFKTINGLIPLLSGMFGVSTLIYSLNKDPTIVKQQKIEISNEVITTKNKYKAIIVSQLSGFLTAIFPGLGAGYAASIASIFIKNEIEFLVVQGGVTTSNFVMSLATLRAISKARNGAILGIVNIMPINQEIIQYLLITALISGGIATIIAIITTNLATKTINKINYKKLTKIILIWVIVLTIILNPRGIGLLMISTGIGIISNVLGVRKSLMMSSIMIPIAIRLL